MHRQLPRVHGRVLADGRTPVHPPGKKEAAGAPTPAAKLNNFKHTGGLIRHGNEADNCCSPLHENTNLRTVFMGL